MNTSPDDSAAHISEEVAGAARTAPIAILVGVGATVGLGWLLLIVISFVVPSIPALLESDLPLPMGQVLLSVIGKRGMLAIWSCIIASQVCALNNPSSSCDLIWPAPKVCLRGRTGSGCIPRRLRVFKVCH